MRIIRKITEGSGREGPPAEEIEREREAGPARPGRAEEELRARGGAEAVADLDRGAPAVAAGPTVKVQLAEATALSASALLGITRAADAATVLFQLTRSL